jgi:hypothetical protein
MEPDRFDDVAFRMIEEPEPPARPPRRRRRWVLASVATVVAAGALAAGASALAGSGDEPARAPAKVSTDGDGIPMYRHHDCHRGDHMNRRDAASDVRY